jgi:hypothetical protein
VLACPVMLSEPALGREHVVRVCRHYGVPIPHGTWADAFVAVRGAMGSPRPPASVPAAA